MPGAGFEPATSAFLITFQSSFNYERGLGSFDVLTRLNFRATNPGEPGYILLLFLSFKVFEG